MASILSSKKIQILLIVVITSLAYVNIFQNEFVIDDKTFIVNWEKGRSISNFVDFVRGEVPKGHEEVYRPIRSVLYAFYYQVFGTNPFYYHLHSILVHLASTSLVYLILRFFVQLSWTQNDIGLFAFFGALLFGLHPIHTETITYIAASMEATGIVFFFASFYLYLQKGTPFKAKHILSVFFAFLAFFTYEMTLTLPVLILLYEVCFFQVQSAKFKVQNYSLKFKSLKNIPQLLTLNFKLLTKNVFPYFFLVFLYLFIRFVILDITSRGFYLAGSFYLTFLATVKVLLKYLILSVFSFGQAHNHIISKNIETILYRGHNLEPILSQKFFDLSFIFALLVLSFVLLFAFKSFKRQPLIFLGIIWFFIALLPVLNIIPQASLMHEKFLYIPSFGIILIFVCLLSKVRGQRAFLIAVPIFLLFFFLTFQRNKVWKDPVTFWSADALKSSKNAYANFQLGEAYLADKKEDKAIESYKKAFEINPSFAVAIASAARTYQFQGKTELAIENYEKAIKADPNFWEGKANLDRIYSSLDKNLTFSFSYPKTWKKLEEGGSTFVKNEKGDFVISFKKERKKPSVPVEEYLSSKTLSYGSLVNQGLAKVPNFDFAFVRIWKDNGVSKHQFFFFKGDKVIEAIAYPSDSALMKDFDKIVESINFN